MELLANTFTSSHSITLWKDCVGLHCQGQGIQDRDATINLKRFQKIFFDCTQFILMNLQGDESL